MKIKTIIIKAGALLLSILVPLALTLFIWPVHETLKPSNILLVYLLGVFFVALRLGHGASFVASLTSAAAFAFFFAPPIYSFAIADQDNLVGLVVMLIVGAITSQQADDVRTQSRLARQREQLTSALYQLSKELAEAPLELEIIEIAVRHIHGQFAVRNTILLPDANGQCHYPRCRPFAISLLAADLEIANQAFEHNQINASVLYLPLQGSTGRLGVMVLENLVLNEDEQQMFNTFINQIVHTLERARLAEQAKASTLKIQEETLRNSLLSSISHDLRTPLATIIGAASTLESEHHRLTAYSRQNLIRAISEEAYRMTDLTNKILQMARLETGQVVLNRQWYEPDEIIGSTLRQLDSKLKNRPVNVSIFPCQPLIFVDAVLLQQVLVNLLDNADKYSPAGLAIDLSVQVTAAIVSITVADYGQGIPIEFRQKIFDKFYQIHAESAQCGVGLGLSICRAIVEAHQGEICVTERSGGGAVFQLQLPILTSSPSIPLAEQREEA